MRPQFAPGQKVSFNKRCVLSPNVPRNAQGYTHMALVLQDGDEYLGEGIIEKGTRAFVAHYASPGTGSSDYPVVRVQGKLAGCHQIHLDPVP